jgi:hypothetical protein
MVDVYKTEAERRAAIQEVTALRRQFDTTTAKGAKAFAADPAAQAALARLDQAKSAAGMRTSAQDLAALNKIATSNKPTAEQTPAERKTERQALNQPSRQYFNQVQEAYRNPDIVPTWQPPKQMTPNLVQEYSQYGTDASKARFDWVWTQNEETGKGRWAIGLVGLLQQKPTDIEQAQPLDLFYSDSAPLAQAREIKKEPSWNATFNNISLDELEQVLPNISFSELQEVYYRLTLDRDEDITIEDIVNKYNELYGG